MSDSAKSFHERDAEFTVGVDDKRLRQVLEDARASLGETAEGRAGPTREDETQLRHVREAAMEALSVDRFDFDEGVVKENLEEILLMMIVLRSGGSHGKQLMDDLMRTFDAHLSPGTVYPTLHKLNEAGLLEQHESVRTKNYDATDDDAVGERFRHVADQHLVLGLMLRAAAEQD